MRVRSLARTGALSAGIGLLAAPLVASAGSPPAPAPGAPVTERATGTRSSSGIRLTGQTARTIRRALAVSTAAAAPLHAASSTSVTISGFKYGPSSVTVNVGDTVTWVNNDPVQHTATSTGTFNTGPINNGASASFKFTKAGTFSYFCKFHPYMKASVTVSGSSSGSGSSGSSSGGSSGSGSSSGSSSPSGSSTGGGSSSGSPLPHTGLEIASLLITGFALLGMGLVLRRGVRYPADRSG